MMSKKDIFNLAKTNNKKNKFQHIIFIIIVCIILLLILLPFSFAKTIKSSIDNKINYDFKQKIIDVVYSKDEEESAQKKLNELQKKDKAIIKFEKYYDGGLEAHLENIEELEDKNTFYIYQSIEYNSPDKKLIVTGRNLKNDNEIICPSTFSPIDDSKIINMNSYINKTLKVKLPIQMETQSTDYINAEYTLVGTYDAKYSNGYSNCYITEKEYENRRESVIKNRLYPEQITSALYIKNYTDVDRISKELSKMNLSHGVSSLNYDYVKSVQFLSVISSIIIFIFSIVTILIYIKIYIKSNFKTLTLYKALGFKQNNIEKIITYQIYLSALYALIITIVLSILIKLAMESLIHRDLYFASITIKIEYIPIIVFMFLTLIIIKLSVKTSNNALSKLSIKELTDE